LRNKRIRVALTQAALSQSELARLLHVSDTEMSIMLKHELAVREQNEIVKCIREYDAQKKGEERRQNVNAV